jgi:hypothetical protein
LSYPWKETHLRGERFWPLVLCSLNCTNQTWTRPEALTGQLRSLVLLVWPLNCINFNLVPFQVCSFFISPARIFYLQDKWLPWTISILVEAVGEKEASSAAQKQWRWVHVDGLETNSLFFSFLSDNDIFHYNISELLHYEHAVGGFSLPANKFVPNKNSILTSLSSCANIIWEELMILQQRCCSGV